MREFGEQGCGQALGTLGQVGVGHQEQSHIITLEGAVPCPLTRMNRRGPLWRLRTVGQGYGVEVSGRSPL
ncbi:hypothetical protein GCM10010103_70230 [Streptomyces paradoxus]